MIKVQTFPLILECHNPVNLTPALTLGLHCKKRWLEDSLHFSITRQSGPVRAQPRQSGETYPALRAGAASYHPGLDYCLICWYKSDVSTIETILYEYSLKC